MHSTNAKKALSSFHMAHPRKGFGIKIMVATILLTAIAVFGVYTYQAGMWYSKPVQIVPDQQLPSPSPPPHLQ